MILQKYWMTEHVDLIEGLTKVWQENQQEVIIKWIDNKFIYRFKEVS